MNQNLLSDYGLNEHILSSKREDFEVARIIDQQKNLYTVVEAEGFFPAQISGKMIYEAQSFLDYPVVGDFVEIKREDSLVIIHRILPRWSLLERKTAGITTEGQMIASNIDTVFICMSMNENYNLRRLERYLSVVFASQAEPIVLLTKSDLSDGYEILKNDVSKIALNVLVITSSSVTDNGYSEIKSLLKQGKTYAFIGSSGVGKSTLVNALLGEEILKTHEVGKMAKGRHTTTSRSLKLTPDGYIIIDTPGMRELQLDQADFENSFQDIETIALSCRFNDCSHTKEPGCAVMQAIDEQRLSFERLNNYRKMKKEAQYQLTKKSKNPEVGIKKNRH